MAKKIMIQGTMSNTGKSFITAGLCRIFRQDGYKTAPFKSQNMALNSYITQEGLEIGRAQAVQAEAAGTKPLSDMNPILLKPNSDTGSQVILHGVPVGDMSAREYFARKKSLIPEIMDSFHRLEEQYDVIVIEGAGSPAEINLKQNDIVNMGLAELVDSPVLLVGDIDRGGVFAQLYGTVMLLEEAERKRIGGLIVNKFRGDVSLLKPGTERIEELLGIPVVGVVPMIKADIDDEDSLSERLSPRDAPAGNRADIAVIRFPHLSNFTDFHVLELQPDVAVRYVDNGEDLGNPDLIILPGTKNTVQDFIWMRQAGLERRIRRMALDGVPVFGICGGFQMMGQELHDPDGTEGGVPGRILPGMDLIPMSTVFSEKKVRSRDRGCFGEVPGILKNLSGMELEGYQIHMGVSEFLTDEAAAKGNFIRCEETCPGSEVVGYADVNIYGTYLHGVFDAPGIVSVLVSSLTGRDPEKVQNYAAYREAQYDRIADVLRKCLDMDRIRGLMSL